MLADALAHVVKAIVDLPDDVRVVSSQTNRGDLLEIHVHPEDLGRVIGRSGRTAKSIRTVVNALSGGRSIRVDVVDTDA